jgi:hypothetical protein
MEIRSLTCFADLSYPLRPAQWRQISTFASEGRRAFADAGFRVQSVRLATQPFPEILAAAEGVALADLAVQVEAAAREAGVGYVSLGPAPGSLGDRGWRIAEQIPEAIAATEGVFFGASITSAAGGVDLAAILATASIIQRVSRGVANGFGNLRLAALANCGPWSPFFPVGYHGGGMFRFAIATEAADLAVQALSQEDSPAEAERRLTALIQREADWLVPVAEDVVQRLGIGFAGIDFSLAPYPVLEKSVGYAMESLTGERFGGQGTLFAAALMTRAVQKADFPKTGFCGLMLPVLEDTVLAARSQEGAYSLDHLLLYSSVCGTGLDTVPLPGEVSQNELAAILADVATLAVRLNKPLTARLMPIPGKRAGERTEFDFEYFANAAILDVRGDAPRLWR